MPKKLNVTVSQEDGTIVGTFIVEIREGTVSGFVRWLDSALDETYSSMED